MKMITFLGATRAYETTYVMPDGREHTAPFCGVALSRFYPDSDILVFVTQDARKRHYDRFEALTEDYAASVTPVNISDGRNEEELWRIFRAVVDHVANGEQVLFDITHGFRSLPFLSFLAAAYLRVVKEIELKGVIYGNFEARDQSVVPNRAPVIDMTRFVGLLDWMIAADRFIRFGDAHDLAERLRAAKPDYRQMKADPAIREQGNRLNQAARALDDVSLALRLLRPQEAMAASEQLQTRLGDGVEGIHAYARPFRPLARQVTEAYSPLAMSKDAQAAEPVAALARERRMVQWYLERRQYVQAMAVAREWIVSWAMTHLGFATFSDTKTRQKVEYAFGKANKQRQTRHGEFDDYAIAQDKNLRDIPEIAVGLSLYERIGGIRNDLLHAGKRPSPLSARKMEQKITSLCNELQSLPLPLEP